MFSVMKYLPVQKRLHSFWIYIKIISSVMQTMVALALLLFYGETRHMVRKVKDNDNKVANAVVPFLVV